MTLATRELVIAPKAPPTMTPMAISITLPREMNALNSSTNFFMFLSPCCTQMAGCLAAPREEGFLRESAALVAGVSGLVGINHFLHAHVLYLLQQFVQRLNVFLGIACVVMLPHLPFLSYMAVFLCFP